MAGSLFVVSTPIGNLDDITVRALDTLKRVSLVAAEDTRRTSLLLRHFGISTPTTSLHEHNERQKTSMLLRKLAEGSDVALVSDAGTPLVADPGRRLIAQAIDQGVRVIPIPGPSAVLAAVSASGYPADEFTFAGFVPARASDRKRWLTKLAGLPGTVVLFEAPHRIHNTLADMAVLLGNRPITVARELTKVHETIARGSASELMAMNIPERGEFTLVLAPVLTDAVQADVVDDASISSCFDQMTNSGALGRRAALVQVARKFGLTPNEVYARLERLKSTGQS